ncbi:IS3 family transposase, partial [Klebsiella pneumoniae]
YPSTKQLGRWVRIYEEKGDLPRELKPRERYSRTQKIAQSIGVSVPVLYKWKKDLISDEAYQSMRKRKAAPQD